MSDKSKKWIFMFSLLILSVPLFPYRFRHSEMTETQLFLNTIEAYREFFKRGKS